MRPGLAIVGVTVANLHLALPIERFAITALRAD
jgi:hypothetical protein